ncbi:hypothetical protein ACHAPJ_007418 [Fusarium lateritium]
MSTHDQSRGSCGLFGCLSPELFNQVISELLNIDIKNLRQTCTYVKDIAHLRLNRVFLSANLRDIQVFRAVADHETFRHDVTEIIYDDARLGHADYTSLDHGYAVEDDIGEVTGVPDWFREVYRENRDYADEQGSSSTRVGEALGNAPGPVESFEHVQRLHQEQRETIATHRDGDAFEYGLLRFPNLRRVTVTPAAHGLPRRPIYSTPTIRSLPRAMVYPLDRGWPVTGLNEHEPEAKDWDVEDKDQWRGYLFVSRILARHLRDNPGSKLSELSLDTHQLLTGISCRIFDAAENSEQNDLITILSQPGFTRLDLSLYCANQIRNDWCSFRSGRLHNILARAPDIQHISLFTNIPFIDDPNQDVGQHFFPLRSIFPVGDWHQLRHFGLSRFHVKTDDLLEFLEALPPTLESVELSFLLFLPRSGDHHALVQGMRERLGWHERRVTDQPKIVVRIELDWELDIGMVVKDISPEVTDFLYHDGKNPFKENEGWGGARDIPEDTGMLVDILGSEYED